MPQEKENAIQKDILLKTAENSELLGDIKNVGIETVSQLEKVQKAVKEIKIPDHPQKMKFEMEGIEVMAIKGKKGDKGDKGDPGPIGPKGEGGPKGEDGKDGNDGKDGKRGEEGEKGVKGDRGEAGKDGEDGQDGKDGQDGSPETADEIVRKINSLPDNIWSPKIDIKNLPSNAPAVYAGRSVSGAAGHTIKNAGTALTTRAGLNFLTPLVATDDAAGDETEISLDSDITTRTVGITLDGQGGVVSTGLKGFFRVPYAGTISGWTILADQSGSIVVDVWKDTYANFPPTVADTIAGV